VRVAGRRLRGARRRDRAALLSVALLGGLAGCRIAGVAVIEHPAPAPGQPTGHAQIRLEEPIEEGEIAVNREVVAVFIHPIRAVVVNGLPAGPHEVLVLGRGGAAQLARLEVGPGLTTARAAPQRWSTEENDALERRLDLFLPPERPPRPCSRLGVIAHLRLGAGVRLCQAIGRHISLEAMAGWLVVNAGAELGVTFHPSTSDWLPYLAVRRGVFRALVGSGSYWSPAAGWRFGRHFIEVGPAFIEYRPDRGESRDHTGPAFIFGWD
jgi:hypothetical protein